MSEGNSLTPKDVIPYGDRILVELATKQGIYKSSALDLVMVHEKNEKEEIGTIKSVSPTIDDKSVAAGQTVIFEKFGGWDITIGGKDYRVIHLDNVIGFINQKKNE